MVFVILCYVPSKYQHDKRGYCNDKYSDKVSTTEDEKCSLFTT